MLAVIALTPKLSGPLLAAAIALAGVLVTLWVNGDRVERQRKRDLHARALAAVLAYAEMPFMIRRRRQEKSERSAERVRLSDHFSAIKAELTTCQVLLRADGDRALSRVFDQLIEVARATAGAEAHRAWKAPPVRTDAEMNMGALFDRLGALRAALADFESAMARATLPRRMRLRKSRRRRSR